MKLEFSRQIFEKFQISNLIKIRPLGAELFQADGRTDKRKDMAQLIVAFFYRSYLTVILSCVYAVFIVTLGVVIYVSDIVLRNGTPLAEVRMKGLKK
jgi:hypothetical protein